MSVPNGSSLLEGGGDGPRVIFECQPCSFRTKNYRSSWMKHILMESHQEKARQRVKFLDVKTKKRSVVVFGISLVKPKMVLKHFGDLAVVTDFIYWKERPDFCIITFIYSKFRDSIILSNHIVQNRNLYLRTLDEIPEAEWISICPYAGHPQEMDSGDANDDDPFEESSGDELMSDGEKNENETISFVSPSAVKPKPTTPTSPTSSSKSASICSADEDNGEDEDESINNESAISDATGKDCTITLNICLFKYFERACSGTRRKLQLLILQHILEFNQKFWTNCLGLVFVPKVGQKFWAEDFSKVLTEGKIKTDQTIMQKVNAISEIEDINLSFRVKSDGKILHKLFLEEETKSRRIKDWASGKSLTEFSLQLYEEVPESRLQEIKSSSYTDYISETEIAFNCQLIGAVYKRTSNSTPMAFLTMNTADGSFGAVDTNNARINVIKGLYRKLCMSYITKMVKRWLYESKDFDHTKALNSVKHRNQKWNNKANKKKKNELKRLVKNEKRINPNKIPVHNPGLKLSKPGGHTYQRPNTLPQFTFNVVFRPPVPLMSVGGGNVPRPQYNNNNWQQQWNFSTM